MQGARSQPLGAGGTPSAAPHLRSRTCGPTPATLHRRQPGVRAGGGLTVVTVVQVVLAVVIMFGASISIVCVAFVVVAAFEGLRSPYRTAEPYFPRTMVLVPAHNESAVIERTVEAMMIQEYPPRSLHVMVIDDASTDGTGAAVEQVARRHPGRVHYLRRSVGGQGKAAVLNAGLGVVLASEWMEAVLIIDADVIFELRAVRSMTRHLANPDVGAVGGYVREGTRPGSSVRTY